MKFYQSKKFKELDDVWQQKLKDSGYIDVEDADKSKDRLKTWHSHWFMTRGTALTFKAKEEYYYRANRFHLDYTFQAFRDRQAWFAHSRALRLNDIAKLIHCSRSLTAKILKELREVMLAINY